jgi:hypothetical protein
MPEFELVMTSNGQIRGYTQEDHKRYVAFRDKSQAMEAGEFMRVKVTYPRNVKLHRKFFAMLNHGFEHWEPERGRKRLKHRGVVIAKSFELFRKDILILAGYGEASFDLKGRVKWDAKSIAFDKMDDETFQRVYVAVYDVLLNKVLVGYSREDFDRVLEELEHFQPT